jgi:hypothetical protein
MKLKNKKTGELGYFCFANWDSPTIIIMDKNGIQLAKYNSLAELNEEWCDYKEPKEYYFINSLGGVIQPSDTTDWVLEDVTYHRQIGNYFESREEAEKAVEKLKAWKLLKDMGFKIEGIRYRNHKNYIEWSISQKVRDDHFTAEGFNSALHLIFGGED